MTTLEYGFHPGYERKGIYSIEAILSELGNSWAVFDGDPIGITSLRYRLFAKSLTCVGCGIVGVYFAKERSAKKKRDHKTGEVNFISTTQAWHFNLDAQRPDGTEVLMTKDHITPKSKGGGDYLGNLQTMCGPCNVEKSDLPYFQPFLPFDGTSAL